MQRLRYFKLGMEADEPPVHTIRRKIFLTKFSESVPVCILCGASAPLNLNFYIFHFIALYCISLTSWDIHSFKCNACNCMQLCCLTLLAQKVNGVRLIYFFVLGTVSKTDAVIATIFLIYP